jgi:pyridoxine 5-phosphate synthase
MAMLTVNLDGVAALREVRGQREPDPAQAAVLAELGGADGVAIQLRRDRRHVRDRDLYVLREVVKTKLIIEIPPTDEIIERALEVKPAMVTFVADHADATLPVSGINLADAAINFSDAAARFHSAGIAVCILVEPDSDSIKGAVKNSADAVLLNCAGFTEARTLDEAQRELDRIDNAAQAASKAGITVYAGRGIGYKNVMALHELGSIDEFFVGHSIIAKALFCGFERAVRDMVTLLAIDHSHS